jgi:hypothetical protein
MIDFFRDRCGDFIYWLETRRHGPTCFLVRTDGETDALYLDDVQADERARELAASGHPATVHSYWNGITSQPTSRFDVPPSLTTPRRRPSVLAERVCG